MLGSALASSENPNDSRNKRRQRGGKRHDQDQSRCDSLSL